MSARKSSKSMIKETLKDLSCSYGWSYGVLWGFHQTASSLLTLQEAYNQQQIGPLIEDMLLQVHVMGRGVIGQAAFAKDHRWMFLDAAAGSIGDSNQFQDFSGLEHPLSMGIKTIAVISVDSLGVVEFGSTQKLPERLDFVTRTKELFNGIQIIQEFITPESRQSFSKFDTCGTGGLFSSLISDPGNLEHNVNASSHCTNGFETFNAGAQLDADYTRASFQPYESLSITNTFGELYYSTDGLLQRSPHTIDQLNKTLESGWCNDQTQTSEPVALTSVRTCQPSTSAQSTITNIVNYTGNKKFHMDKQFDCSRVDKRSESTADCAETLIPILGGENFNFSASAAECISELHADPKQGTINTALSNPERYQHVKDIAGENSLVATFDFDDHLSSIAKRRKLESSSQSSNQVKYVHGFPGDGNPLQSVFKYQNRTNTIGFMDEGARMPEPCMYSGNDCSNVTGDSISTNSTLKQAVKSVKQKAKPGTKPRPKDRQQIHERLLQLRKLIPDSEKMSIDSLLHQTINHLLYLQSVTKHAEHLRRNNEAEMAIGEQRHMIRKENPSSSNGITWACEVGNETMFCPLIVEDLSVPGQMLIEQVLCQDQDFFLQIVDIIRGFGLTIMKGVMEARESKIWAQFTVEAEEGNRVTRHEVFSSLVQLLQLTEPTEVKNAQIKCNSIDRGEATVGNTHPQPKVGQVLI